MRTGLEFLVSAVCIGAGATLVMDTWLILRKRVFGVPVLNYGLLGRWVAHIPRGLFMHDDIARAKAVRGERVIGWCVHYAIGISFAALLIALWGMVWIYQPTLGPALMVGIVTVLAPLFILQPAMGLGIAGSKAPKPNLNRFRSLVTHFIYGLGLYLAALLYGFCRQG